MLISLEVLLIFILILGNGVFAMTEIAVVASRKARLERRSSRGDRKARAALQLSENPNDFLSTVQIGITLVGVLAGAFGGATISEQIGERLDVYPQIAPYGETIGIAVVVLGITYVSLIIGELVPKRIALLNPERVASLMAPTMMRVSAFARPVVRFLSFSSDVVSRALRLPISSSEPPVTEEELTSMLQLGTTAGQFHPREAEMIRGVFALGDLKAKGVMTRRREVVWLDVDDPWEVQQGRIIEAGFTRYPVGAGTLDDIVGIIYLKDLMAACFRHEPVSLQELMREPLVVPDEASALQVLSQLRESGSEIAIVVDEYGSVEGVITVEDLAGEVIGDSAGPELVQREDGSWLVDGMMSFSDFWAIIHVPGTGPSDHETLAGFIIDRMGRLPSLSDRFEAGDLRFEVVDMDGKRIDKVLVDRLGGVASRQ